MEQDTVDIIGAGNWGSSLAAALPGARVVRRAGWKQYGGPAKVVWLCVGDREIARVGRELARRWAKAGERAEVVLHSSGALASDALAPLRELGVAVGSVHPWMTFPSRKAVALAGVWFGVEGDRRAVAAARRMIAGFGGRAFLLSAESKALYHAFAAMNSPLLVSHLAAAEAMARDAGIAGGVSRKLVMSLVRATLKNYEARGAAASFSGPIARGDGETLVRHRASLYGRPEGEVYDALTRYAIATLPAKRKNALRRAVKGTKA